MKIILSALVFIFALASPAWCQSESSSFVLDGSYSLTLFNKTDQARKIRIDNWFLAPMTHQRIDTVILPNAQSTISVKMQGWNYLNFTIDNSKTKVFAKPKENDTIMITDHDVKFSGPNDLINQFLKKRTKEFGSPDSDWLPRIEFRNKYKNFSDLVASNDSLTLVHQDFLRANSNSIPLWYLDFELQRLNYLNASDLLSSALYRKMVLQIEENVNDLVEKFLSTLDINNAVLASNSTYIIFLLDYLDYFVLDLIEDSEGSIQEAFFNFANDRFDEKTRDIYLLITYSLEITRNQSTFQQDLIDNIEDQNFCNFLVAQYEAKPILERGSPVPYFYLPDANDEFHRPGDYSDSIMLINFWAPWCKPCIKEFSFENELVDRYSDQPVIVLNICVDSSTEQCLEYVSRYDLKTVNLFPNENWNRIIKDKFGISSLPHSVLVDQGGLVEMNRSPSASNGAAKLIDKMLLEKR